MKRLSRLGSYTKGWIIGDFEQALLRNRKFEVGVQAHKADELWEPHYHTESTEINVILSGWTTIELWPSFNPLLKKIRRLREGDVFVILPGEVSSPSLEPGAHGDRKILCIKVPSRPNDKVVVTTEEKIKD